MALANKKIVGINFLLYLPMLQLRSYLKEKVSGSGLENREYGHKDLLHCHVETSILKSWH
jgi:hypothetical protein